MNRLKFLPLLIFTISVFTSALAQDTTKLRTATAPKKNYPQAVKPGYTKPAQNPYAKTVTPAAPVVVDNSLNGRYKTALAKMYYYQAPLVTSLYKSFTDTLNVQKHLLKDAQNKIAAQKSTIDTLQGSVNAKDQSLNESRSKINQVGFFGASVSKATYNTIMWGLVLVLGASLVAVIYLSASSRREAAYRIKLYEELSAEFQTYKTKSNEKEKKLARELQTERNKLDELGKK